MSRVRPATKILVDGGDPDETLHIKNLLGFVDGQTTNPTYVSKNPDVQRLMASGKRFSRAEQNDEYKKIVQKISHWLAQRVCPLKSLLTSTRVQS